MTDNGLVADSVDLTTPFNGTFLLEDGEALCAAISSGDWVAGGMAAFSLALDGISMALDPIGSLIAMGLGWLMDHLEPLKGWLNDLTGDAGEVAGFAATWQNIAAYLGDAGVALEDSLRTLSGMQGATADAVRAFQADAGRHLAAAGQWAGAIGTGMSIASAIVKMVHDMTRDAISTIVGSLASAALTTVVTVGFGAPVAVAQVASKVASLAGKLTKFITNLLRSVKQLIGLVDELMRLFRRLMTSVRQGIRNVPTRTPGAPASPRSMEVPGRPLTPGELDELAGQGYHTSIFGDQVAHHYNRPDATLGAPGSHVWAMPTDDAARITTPAAAARETGMAPTVLDAHLHGGDVYAVHFPVDPSSLRRPTTQDANGWEHFYADPTNRDPTYGHTAVNTGTWAYLVNTTRETLVAGGGAMPAGAVLTRLVDGAWVFVRAYR